MGRLGEDGTAFPGEVFILVRCGLVELHAWGRNAAGVRTVDVLRLTAEDYPGEG
jgi:hypothetical protein